MDANIDLSFENLQVAKNAERRKIMREVSSAAKSRAQIAAEHHPLGGLKAEQIVVRLDLAKQIV